MHYYLIYKITNRLNNKIYVGAHKTKNKNDDYFGSGLLLERAVEKHGKENFVKEILFDLSTEEEMWQKEADIVDEDFIARDDTYNIKLGGCGGFDYINENGMRHKHSTEFLKKMAKLGTPKRVERWKNDEDFRNEYKMKLSLSHKRYCSVNGAPFLGKSHTEETKTKLREKMRGKHGGKNNPNYGNHWITNGIENKLVKNTIILEGWRKGRI